MFDYRVLLGGDGKWVVRAMHAEPDAPIIGTGFLSGSDAARWLAEHLARLESRGK